MKPDVAADENHVHGEHHGAAENNGIAAVQAAETFGGDGEKIEAYQSSQGSGPNPHIQTASSKECQEKRDDYDARAGDEGGLRRSRVFQPAGLKDVGGEHAEADLDSGPRGFSADAAKRTAKPDSHHHSGEREADCEVNQDRNVGEGVLYGNESCAPDERAES